jgi:hypothetical protein
MVIKYVPRITPKLNPKKVPTEWTDAIELAANLGFYTTEIKRVLKAHPDIEYDDWSDRARRIK